MVVSSSDERELDQDLKSENYNSSLEVDENVQTLCDQERGNDGQLVISIDFLTPISVIEEEKFLVVCFRNGESIQDLTSLEDIK